MTDIQMFSRLPPIDFERNEPSWRPHVRGSRSEAIWPAEDSAYTNKTLDAFDPGAYFSSWDGFSYSNGRQSIVEPSVFQGQNVWQGRAHHDDTHCYPSSMHGFPHGYNQWHSTLPLPSQIPTPVSFVTDRSLSEQSSCSGGAWSPEPSEDCPENEATEAPLCSNRFLPQEMKHHSPAYNDHAVSTKDVSQYGNPRPRVGIALSDVQHLPDTYSEEHFENPTEQDIQVEHPYCLERRDYVKMPEDSDSVPTYGVQEALPNQQVASSTLSLKPEEDSAAESGTKEVDEDDSSDYSPTSRKKRGHQRQGSRTSSSSKHPALTSNRVPKNVGGSYGLSKTTKVSKQRTTKRNSAVMPSMTVTLKGPGSSCPHCPATLPTPAALNKHVTAIHTRPFVCTFSIYGCPGTFGSKNEWKRHVSSQHLRLGIWRCDLGACDPKSQRKTSSISSSHPPKKSSLINDDGNTQDLVYNDFNRKDLFTQHLRRMHAPQSAFKADQDRFNASLDEASKRCLMDIRDPPPYSVCGCCAANGAPEAVFKGPGSWEERMEHVGRHLEGGHANTKAWVEDVSLRDWLIKEGLIEQVQDGSHRLVGLKRHGAKASNKMLLDEDAVGEEE
ncbi:hypothetical protein MMC20_005680 [Loxospora ochrophaea]|nr:hypothetical protein [Loxospora ochrophaea]